MKAHSCSFLSGIIALILITLLGCNSQPATTPQPLVLTPSPAPTEVAASPAPVQSPTPIATPARSLAPTLALPVLAGTPVPLPQEPITPDNVDRIQQLALWGRGSVRQVAYSPDGLLLAVGTTTGVWLQDAKTLELRRFTQTENDVMALAFLSDGQLIAQVGGKMIQQWDVATGTLVGSWSVGVSDLRNVVFAPEGKLLASALEDGQIGYWDIATGQLLRTSAGYPNRLAGSLAFSPDGSLLASGTNDHTVKLWEVETGALWRDLQGQADPVTAVTGSTVAFSPDGQLLASVRDNDILLWEIEAGVLVNTLQGHTAQVQSLAFSPDGRQLASGAFDKTVRLWQVSSGKLLHTLMERSSAVYHLAFSADGATLVSTIHLWKTATGDSLGTLEGYGEGASALAVSVGGSVFTGHAGNKGIQEWDLRTGQVTRTLTGHTSTILNLAISADDKILASSEHTPPSVWLWDLASGQRLQMLSGYISAGNLALSPDGQLLASSNEYVVYIDNVQTGERLYTLKGGERGDLISNLAFSPDGLKLASGASKVTIFDPKTGEVLTSLGSGLLAWAPDGKTIATGDDRGEISLWDVEKEALLDTLSGHQSWVTGLAFSPDGTLLVSGARDGMINLWQVETRRLLGTLKAPFVEDILFLEGTILISVSTDSTVRWWGVLPK